MPKLQIEIATFPDGAKPEKHIEEVLKNIVTEIIGLDLNRVAEYQAQAIDDDFNRAGHYHWTNGQGLEYDG